MRQDIIKGNPTFVRQKIASITQWWRIPSVCALCNHYHLDSQAVCKLCTRLFVRIDQGCAICRLPLIDNQFLQCGHCIKKKPAFDKVITSYSFEEPLRTLLHDFKYHSALYLRNFMTELMLDSLTENTISPGCLVPVPMHPTRLKERGFNHAALLAKSLAKRLKTPCNLDLCRKKVNSVAQAGLSSKMRHRNIKNTFHAKPNTYTHITLVDDLLTTGSTVNELAKTLKRSGVSRVDIWCLARTPIT